MDGPGGLAGNASSARHGLMVGQTPAGRFHPAIFVGNIIRPAEPFHVAIASFVESRGKRLLRRLIPHAFAGEHGDRAHEAGVIIVAAPRCFTSAARHL